MGAQLNDSIPNQNFKKVIEANGEILSDSGYLDEAPMVEVNPNNWIKGLIYTLHRTFHSSQDFLSLSKHKKTKKNTFLVPNLFLYDASVKHIPIWTTIYSISIYSITNKFNSYIFYCKQTI